MTADITIVLTNADGLERNTGPCILILQIERSDIEACNIASTLAKLHIISDTRKNALLYRESLAFHVRGYDDDKRELPEIHEVREYFKRLTQEWPHWLWFMNRGIGAIALLVSLMCECKVCRENDHFGIEFVDVQEVGKCIIDLFERGNAMFIAHGISEAQAKCSAESAMHEIFGG